MKPDVNVHAFTMKSECIRNELRIPVFLASTGDEIDKTVDFPAILDTGATGCSITSRAARKIGAIPCRIKNVVGVHGAKQAQPYNIDLLLPSNVFIPDVIASEMSDEANFDVLVGMEVLNRGDFCVTNYQGKTVFTFRVPSLEVMDYTLKTPKGFHWANPKVGRNDPCPCGSGKKYKKCCGKP